MFKKAESAQRYFKVGVFGIQGSGKTFTTLLWAEALAAREKKKIAFWDTEHGSDFYTKDVPSRTTHPKKFVFDADYGKSLTNAAAGFRALDPKEYGVLVIDSMTHIWNAAVESYHGKRTSIGTIPIAGWGIIKPPYRSFLEFLLNCPMHVFILGREGKEYGPDDGGDGEDKVLGPKMKAEAETGHEPHIVIRMFPERGKTKGRSGVFAYFDKDRTSVLHGKTIKNPTFVNTFKLMVPYLKKSGKQATVQTAEDAAKIDAENLAGATHDKERRSKELLMQFSDEYSKATTKAQVKAISAKVTKAIKDQMVATDVASLRNICQSRIDSTDDTKKADKERADLIAEIDAMRDGWDEDSWLAFIHKNLYGRQPEWPSGCALVDLRVLKKAILKLEPPADAPSVAEGQTGQGSLA